MSSSARSAIRATCIAKGPGPEPSLFLFRYRGAVVGEQLCPAGSGLGSAAQPRLPADVRERVVARRLIADFELATRGACQPDEPVRDRLEVTVVVTTKDRPEDLRRCLESLQALDPPPARSSVVDASDDPEAGRRVAGRYPVDYVSEPGATLARARNCGLARAQTQLVAFIEDDCTVEAGWLAGLDAAFADPSLAAVAGFVAPVELGARGQWLFDGREAPRRCCDPARLGGLRAAWFDLRYRNAVFRRSAITAVGPFADGLGPGTDADLSYRLFTAGYWVEIDPARVAWHRHPTDESALERSLLADLVGRLAVASRSLAGYRDPVASAAALRSAIAGLRGSARCLERREPGSGRRAVAGALRRGAVEAPSLLRALRTQPGPRETARDLPPGPARVGRPPAVRASEAEALTVIVPSRNRRAMLQRVLSALRAQTYPAGRFEVVVVLDGSTDGSAELVRSLETPYELRLLEQENRGLAATRNRGARAAREDLLVFLDDDLVPEPQFLAEHAAAHRGGEREHMALGECPPVVDGAGLLPIALADVWRRHYRCKGQPQHRWTYADIVGGNCSVRRALVLDMGGWDERFIRREDWELGVRMLGGGVSFSYRPGARAWHHFQSTLATELRKRRTEARDDVYFARKHPHLKAQLPLAHYAAAVGSSKGRLAFRYRRLGQHALRAALPVTGGLEALRLRRQWLRAVDRLVAYAYLLGLFDAMPTREELVDLLAPVLRGELVETLDVTLGEPGCLEVPPGAGALALRVRYPDAPVARVRGLDPEDQWDWEAIERRLVAAGADRVPPVADLRLELDVGPDDQA